ncbi:MAG: hypothetical protein ACLPVY_02685 [Acidimicrobiia bacterium]
MKREIAERLAASCVDGVSVADARKVINAFLSEIAKCSVCDDQGTLKVARGAHFELAGGGFDQPPEGSYIEAGKLISCPRCGSRHPEEAALKHDPDWVGWRCYLGFSESDCRGERESDTSDKGWTKRPHAKCGYQVMLALESVKGD